MLELGSRLQERAYRDEAEQLDRECFDRRRTELGDTMQSMTNLASLLEGLGCYEEAEQLLRRALENHHAKLGSTHRDTLASMNCLAMVLQAQGQHEEAESLHREELQASRTSWARCTDIDEQSGALAAGTGTQRGG